MRASSAAGLRLRQRSDLLPLPCQCRDSRTAKTRAADLRRVPCRKVVCQLRKGGRPQGSLRSLRVGWRSTAGRFASGGLPTRHIIPVERTPHSVLSLIVGTSGHQVPTGALERVDEDECRGDVCMGRAITEETRIVYPWAWRETIGSRASGFLRFDTRLESWPDAVFAFTGRHPR